MQWDLKQIRLFVNVAEHQSFSAVTRELERVQPVMSNSIALLEAGLGVTLFEHSSGCQPRLTDEGRVLLAEVREVLCRCKRLQGRVLGLARGEEPRLRLTQDGAMPCQPVLDSPEALAQRFPGLEVQASSGGQGDVACRLLEEQTDLGLLLHHECMPESLERRRLGSIGTVTMCGAGHPLAGLQRVSCRELAQRRRLLVIPQQSDYPGGEQISPQMWRLDSSYSIAGSLMCNLGRAQLPWHVTQYPTYGRLMVELTSDWTPLSLVVELAWRHNEVFGSATAWLGETFTRYPRAIG